MVDMTADEQWMRRAVEISRQGEGTVEPNPMVGCVLVKDGQIIGEGWHEKFGEAHAEVNAIRNAEANVEGATAYVTLEPCSHHGKTPPCSEFLIKANIDRVVVAVKDPNPLVAGQGIAALRAAGIEVTEGVATNDALEVLAPYLKKTKTGKPWVIAKWAMTIDGKIATACGDSQWISNENSRAIVHQIRGRVDAIMVGSGTAVQDDPMLNARPASGRTALRVVFDSAATVSIKSRLVQTASEFPTLIAVGAIADQTKLAALRSRGCEILVHEADTHAERLDNLLVNLASRGVTNVLVEGGGGLLGLLNDLGQIDELHAFIGPKLVGGQGIWPVSGDGSQAIEDGETFHLIRVEPIQGDVYCTWRKISSVFRSE